MTHACIPEIIEAGTTVTVAIVEPVDGVSYTLLLRGLQQINVDAVNGVFTISSVETAAFPAGKYAYAIRANSPEGAVGYIQKGNVVVAPNFADMAEGTDLRTENEIALAAIKAVLARRASMDQQRYKINNRELDRTPIADLIKLRALYVREVRRERGGIVIREHSVRW